MSISNPSVSAIACNRSALTDKRSTPPADRSLYTDSSNAPLACVDLASAAVAAVTSLGILKSICASRVCPSKIVLVTRLSNSIPTISRVMIPSAVSRSTLAFAALPAPSA